MNQIDNWSDAELRTFLELVDTSQWEITDFEAEFIEGVLYNYKGLLSAKQRKTAFGIIKKYIEV